MVNQIKNRKELCLVCSRTAKKRVHWRIFSCNGCNVFFNRAMKSKKRYTCKSNGACSITINEEGDRICRGCRVAKCIAVGMARTGDLQKLLKDYPQFAPQKSELFDKNGCLDSCIPGINEFAVSSDSYQVSPCVPFQNFKGSYSGLISENQSNNLSLFLDLSLPPYMFATASPFIEQEKSSYAAALSYATEFAGGQSLFQCRLSRSGIMQRSQNVDLSVLTNPYQNGNSSGLICNNFSGNTEVTFDAVRAAVEVVFGDQIGDWTASMQEDFRRGIHVRQPDPLVNTAYMVAALNYHNRDCVRRHLEFGSLLPGTGSLEASDKLHVTPTWKWLLYIGIHAAPFMTDVETHVTIGPQRLKYGRYWHEGFMGRPLFMECLSYTN